MKRLKFENLLDGQATNANKSAGEQKVDFAKEGGEQEIDDMKENAWNEEGGLRHSRSYTSRELKGRRTKRRLPTASGKKGLREINRSKGSNGKKGSSDEVIKQSTGKKGSLDEEEHCNICPNWSPITQLSSSGLNSGKKGYKSGKKGNNSDCGCGYDCDCGSR
eukprot:3658930-Ditylum_brightwellii.AAC.1